ncbi:ImmA/IrrE family metallo-endopeptidase [Methanocalculus taiwanensis]|uniref:ImmA/IrrE family metallo-endopeptidase n=2 Tax=Methanocalculus taiwanensis TaxID=106207 RepID=A0ABD4TEN3_9EURY|nr:ImmA/IrrE family metallo-endopeptidase [Methanocalculus taiwanensis]
MTVALINPGVLRWARERARIGPDRLAKSASVTPERILRWEEGMEKPTFRQAQEIAKKLHIPFGYLFLSHPPEEKLPIPDLRRIGDHPISEVSADLFDLLADTLYKHDWYRDYLIEQGEEKLPFIGRFDPDADPREIAADMTTTLSLTLADRTQVRSWEQFYDFLVRRAEAAGIWVMRSGIVANNTHRSLEIHEFRGFAICDEIAPLVFINGNDAKAAQIFTLVHEMTHLWIGKSGISNTSLDRPVNGEGKDIEKICNAVAAEVLVPEGPFLHTWEEIWQKESSPEDTISTSATFFRVSTVVIARRALDLGLIEWPVFVDYYRSQEERWQRRREEQGGGNFFKTLPVRYGRRFTEAVVRSTFDQSLLMREAGRMLNISPSRIQPLAEQIGVW